MTREQTLLRRRSESHNQGISTQSIGANTGMQKAECTGGSVTGRGEGEMLANDLVIE